MRGMIIGACAVVAAIAFAACGGSDDSSSASSSSTTASITKEEFLTEGNQICAEGNKTIDAAASDFFGGGEPSQADIEAFITETAIPSGQGQVEQLKALGVPAGDEEELNTLFDALDAGLAKAEEDPSLLDSSEGDPVADANKLAADYGLTECFG